MIPNLNQHIKNPVFLKKEDDNKYDLFTFLTNFKGFSLRSKTIFLDPSLQLTGKLTTKGKFKVCNTNFYKAINCSHSDVKEQSINTIFHPEMPKVILDVVKSELQKGNKALAIIKEIDNDGHTVWVNSQFTRNTSGKLNIACQYKGVPTSKKTIEKINRIYKTLFLLENHSGYEIAKKYFNGMLEMEYGNYEGFLIDAFQ